MYQPGLTLLAILAPVAGAYALRMKAVASRSLARVESVERRESDVLEAVRVLTAASRESTQAVLIALDRTLRVLNPALDAVLIFEPAGEDLACIYAAGARTEHFASLRIPRDQTALLPPRAALCGHRVELADRARAVIPTDRAALAIPMLGGEGLAAVVYASSATDDRIERADLLVRAVAQAASPYLLAADREADRATATFDSLTGLYTPRAFRESLQLELSAPRAQAAPLSLWFIDTDHFKRVNDTFGHAAGDRVLQHMAAILRDHSIGGLDLAARNGGDEFCAVVRNVQKTAAIERAQRFCDAVRAHDFGAGIRLSASIGVASHPYDARSASELLEVADAAMYHSKRSGRDRVSFAVGQASFSVYQ